MSDSINSVFREMKKRADLLKISVDTKKVDPVAEAMFCERMGWDDLAKRWRDLA